MTAKCWPSFHIQSMIWATDTVVESKTPKSETYSDSFPVPHHRINACFHNTAVASEIRSSALITAAGYKSDAMTSAHRSREDYGEACDNSTNGDVLRDKKHHETTFLKSNRDIDPIAPERPTDWTNGRGYNSYRFCVGLANMESLLLGYIYSIFLETTNWEWFRLSIVVLKIEYFRLLTIKPANLTIRP
jgi:hypothetical protein